jgi:hypothetical protein
MAVMEAHCGLLFNEVEYRRFVRCALAGIAAEFVCACYVQEGSHDEHLGRRSPQEAGYI